MAILERVDEAHARDLAQVADSSAKRTLDLVGALLALLVLAPLLVLVAAAILVESRGPVLFRQTRTGLGGRTFEILKFRSMHVHADADVRQATRGDARVTKVGALIRALSIDEVPQLINIVRGEMSLVGPRPHAVSHDAKWRRQVHDYDERFRARPGLTGLAQVAGYRGEVNSQADIEMRVREDKRYVREWSLKLDLLIICRTIPLLFRDPNAF